MPGFMVSIFSNTGVSQAAWSRVHGSGPAECVGRKEAEPPTTTMENNKGMKSLRIIVCPLSVVKEESRVLPLSIKIVAVGRRNVTQEVQRGTRDGIQSLLMTS